MMEISHVEINSPMLRPSNAFLFSDTSVTLVLNKVVIAAEVAETPNPNRAEAM